MRIIQELPLYSVALVLSLLAFNGQVFGPHDNGLGKSKDHDPYSDATSISSAPEPATGLLFLAGAGAVTLRLRRLRKGRS